MPRTDPFEYLAGAEAAISNPEETRVAVEHALQVAPHEPEVRLAAYRFYYYNHDYAEAIEQAEWILAHAARYLNIAADWRDVAPGDAEFSVADEIPSLYMQSLIALGYCAARCDRRVLAREALEQAVLLDPSDRLGASWLLAHLNRDSSDES
ncbi:MAG: hypothetical protein KDK53_08575 [Maritimibacter sp.]|nr:hypothetical protein [Maritimibacter sp.]